MARPFTTGQQTTTIRVPARHKEKVLDYIEFLKQQEKKFTREKISEAKAIVQQAGLIDLHSIAQSYGVSVADEQGKYLPKENLRARLISFLDGY